MKEGLGLRFFPAAGFCHPEQCITVSPCPFRSALGANDKIRVGFIGSGNRGTQLMQWFMNNPLRVAALYLQKPPPCLNVFFRCCFSG